jgi:hypothetical protein
MRKTMGWRIECRIGCAPAIGCHAAWSIGSTSSWHSTSKRSAVQLFRLLQRGARTMESHMARRKKTSPIEGLLALVVVLPWWAGVGLALASHLLLHRVASQPAGAATQLPLRRSASA